MEEEMVKAFIQKEIIRNNGGQDLEATDNLIERGVIDSLGIVKMLDYLEKAFGIEVADDELLPENFETIQTIAAFVRRKQGINIGKGNTGAHYLQPGI